jgi:predicted RNA binding protein YcfA (HicA-like mRNA interferase family)
LTKNVSPKKLIKALEKLGFERTRITGSHHRFVHYDGRKTTVPIHGNEPIGPGLLNKIIRQDLKISKEEFIKIIQSAT